MITVSVGDEVQVSADYSGFYMMSGIVTSIDEDYIYVRFTGLPEPLAYMSHELQVVL